MLALLQRLADLALHGRQDALGLTDFVIALRGYDDAVRVLGLFLKRNHGLRQALHRAHKAEIERGEDQTRRDDRDEERQLEDAARIGEQLLADRRLIDNRFDELTALQPGLADDAQ